MIMVKIVRYIGLLSVTDNSSEPHVIRKDEAWSIVNLRSIGYYKVKQSIIQHHIIPFMSLNHCECYVKRLIS